MFFWSACWTMFYLGFPSKAHPPLLTENLPPSCQDVRVLGRACTHSIGQACKKKWTTKPRTALILQQITGSYGKWKHTRWKYSCWLVGLDNLRQTGKTFATFMYFCTFTGLNNAVVYQNWQISGMHTINYGKQLNFLNVTTVCLVCLKSKEGSGSMHQGSDK